MLINCLAACAHLTITVRYSEILVENRQFFHTPLAFDAPIRGVPVGIAPPRLVWKKLEWLGYPMVGKISKISLFFLAQLTNVTDRQTDRRTDTG